MKRTYFLLPLVAIYLNSCKSEPEVEDHSEEQIEELDDTIFYEDESGLYTTDEMGSEEKFDGIDTSPFEIGQFEILEIVKGDLNKDGIDEAVVAYDTHFEGEWGNVRNIFIYKGNEDEGWEEWFTSSTAIMESESGGMMGDGFDGIEIKKGVLSVFHWGGSREKWSYEHKYRFQDDDFYCIGATTSGGAPCEYFYEFDYNLSNGNAVATDVTENCEDESNIISTEDKVTFTFVLDQLPTFKNIVIGENVAINPDTGVEYHF